MGNILGRAPRTAYVHEPDGDHDPFAFRARRGSFIMPVLAPGDPAPDMERLWAGALAGGERATTIRNRLAWRQYRRSPVSQRWDAWLEGRISPGLRLIAALAQPRVAVADCDHVVAKSVRAEWSVEWIAQRFSPTVVIVERHPLNALASWSELGFGNDPRALTGLGRYSEAHWNVKPPPPDAPLIRRQAFVYGVGSASLREVAARHPEWIRARHEVLCVDPQMQARKLLADVGLAWGDATERYLAESDREGSGYHTQRKAQDQPERWKSRLDEEQVAIITETLAAFPYDLTTA